MDKYGDFRLSFYTFKQNTAHPYFCNISQNDNWSGKATNTPSAD